MDIGGISLREYRGQKIIKSLEAIAIIILIISFVALAYCVYISFTTEKNYASDYTAEPTSVYTQKGEKRNGNLRYTIRPIAEAVERYYEQQLIRLHEENRRQAALKKLAEFDRKHGKSAV